MVGSWCDDVAGWARERGFQVAFGRPSVVDAARAEVERQGREGELVAEYTDRFSSDLSRDGDLRVRAIFALSAPMVAYRVVFNLPDGPVEAILPPEYSSPGLSSSADVRKGLETGPLAGLDFAFLAVPLKSVAARLGLVTYGRNNLTYAAGSGSYHRLYCVAVADDLEGDLGRAQNRGSALGLPAADLSAYLSPECETCDACRRACPTGAIGGDRFLLHAERCVTWFNEEKGEVPDWMPATAHRFLIGCLACQEVCPKNRGLLRFGEPDLVFTVEETTALLAPDPKPPASVREKFKTASAEYDAPVYGRNLRALLAAKARPRSVAGAARHA